MPTILFVELAGGSFRVTFLPFISWLPVLPAEKEVSQGVWLTCHLIRLQYLSVYEKFFGSNWESLC